MMKRLLIFSLIFLTSCEIEFDEPDTKYIDFGSTKYPIVEASDSCQYYAIKMATGYTTKSYYYHYPQCSWCKKHK